MAEVWRTACFSFTAWPALARVRALHGLLVFISDRLDRNGTLDSLPGREYDEETFLYFLQLERARADRSNRPLRLLFATLEPVPGKPVPIPRATAARLFDGLRDLLRETDVMGWYRQHRVAGAVLSERADRSGPDVSSVIRIRVGEGLRQRLPARVGRSVRVGVVQLGPPQLGNG